MAQNWLQMGSFHLIVHPNGPGSFLENALLAHFWFQDDPFSRHFGHILRSVVVA